MTRFDLELDSRELSAFMFDFDGTLCDTEADIKKAWLRAMQSLACTCPQFEQIFYTGPTVVDTAKMLFPDRDDAFRNELVGQFAIFYDTSDFNLTVPYSGIERWLTKLEQSGKKLFLVTNKRIIPTKILLRKLGWEGLFNGVYTPDMFEPKLSKAELIARAVKEHKLDSSQTIMVGDSENDIAAAITNGVRSLKVGWGYGTAVENWKVKPDYQISLEQLEGI